MKSLAGVALDLPQYLADWPTNAHRTNQPNNPQYERTNLMPSKPASPRRKTPRTITPALIREALACIPADFDRDTWARVGMAIKSEMPDEGGFELWDEWSQRGATYNKRDARDTWRSIKAGGRTTIGTLFGIAKDHGFKFPDDGAVQTPEQVAAAAAEAQRLAELKKAQQEAEAAELQQQHEEAARRCQAMWDAAADAPPKAGAGYLKRKAVQAYGLRFAGGVALVPMRDADGRLWSVQRLLPKRLQDPKTKQETTDKLYGPAKQGAADKVPHSRKAGLFHVLGTVEGAPALLLGEGYATCATVHEAVGLPVVVCFDSGNLLHVARELRQRHPALPLLVCGDDDRATEAKGRKNAGKVKAQEAAELAGAAHGLAAAVLPPELPEGGSDFNDMAGHVGLPAVAEVVRQAVEALTGAATGDDAARAAAPAGAGDVAPLRPAGAPALRLVPGGKDADKPAPDAAADEAAGKAPAAGRGKRGKGRGGAGGGAGGGSGGDGTDDGAGPPSRDPFYVDEQGLWYVARDAEGHSKPPLWISAPLHVTAITRDESDNGYGYLIEFSNRDGNHRTWAAPASLFGGDGKEWAAKLRDMGFRMATGSRACGLVGQYIDSRNPQDRVICTDRVGWHDGVYVLPSRTIGKGNGKRYVFQTDSGIEDLFRRRGELAKWQELVSDLARGNTRLVFALSCAFAGPVLSPLGVQTGGFHIVGDSSLGKTTALLVAASVWGSPKFKQQWRTTDNGLESVAVQSSDGLLILDEIGQMDGRVVGDCAYMLGNEAEKIRGSRGLLARRRRTWRLLFLSSGEKDLATHMQEAGKKPNEGQLVRMPSVPGDAGAGLGMLEDLHGVAEGEGAGKVFAETITAGAALAFGSAGAAWLEWLAANMARVCDWAPAEMRRLEHKWVPPGAHAQVWRVATRFALVAVAGELASESGITGWEPGEAEHAARTCFEAWLVERGHAGNGEDAAMLRQIQEHIAKCGSANYHWTHRATDDHNKETPFRFGFKRFVDDEGVPLTIDEASEYVDERSKYGSSSKRSAHIEYLILPEMFRKEVCRGMNYKAVAKLLRARGHLKAEAGKLTNKVRIPGGGTGPVPVFHVLPSILADELEGEGGED